MTTYKRLIASMALMAVLAGSSAQAQSWLVGGNNLTAIGLLGSTTPVPFSIRTNNIERMHWTTAGDVGIGTATPGRRLHVFTNPSAPQLRLSDFSGDAWDIWAGANFHIRTAAGTDWLEINPGGNSIEIGPSSDLYVNVSTNNVGIGTTSPASRLTVNGSITSATGCWNFIGTTGLKWNVVYACKGTISTSDARMKENVQDLTYGLDDIMKLHPVSFTWKHDPAYGTKLGLLAQEVQAVIPDVTRDGENGGSMGIFYSDMIPVLIKGIQQQQETLQAEQAENSQLLQTIESQERRISELESAFNIRDQR